MTSIVGARRSATGRLLAEGVRAGLVGAVLGGVPSTAHAVLTGRDPREATVAAGSIVLPREHRERRLMLVGALVHLSISAAWGITLAATLPRRHTALAGAVGGVAIAAVDLGLVGRHVARIAGLPLLPQLADHVVYGTSVGVVLSARRPDDAPSPAR